MTKTQICSVNSDQCPISNSDSRLTACQKLLTSMGFATVKLGGSEITDKHSLNWFKPVCAHMSEITD